VSDMEPVDAKAKEEADSSAALWNDKQKELDAAVLRESGRRTRRSFLIAATAAAGGYGFYRWIDHSDVDELLPKPLREALNNNAAISQTVFDERGLAPTYRVAQSKDLRVNGVYGIKEEIAPENYRLQVVGVEEAKRFTQYVDDVTAWDYKFAAKAEDKEHEGHDTKVAPKDEAAPVVELPPAFQAAFARLKKEQGNKRPRGQEEAGKSDSTLAAGTPGLLLKIEDVTRFQRHELVTQFKCIEGWSEIVHWGGVRLADFIAAYPPAKNAQGQEPKYVYMETPDGDYYCGFHLNECRHPQSLLVTEMAGRPLEPYHGAPLRLHMPIKYGYKQIKRIGLIAYTDEKPDDYWTKLGYDWYAGI
jgi:Oxidoreductase molybdopterin binding domain